MLYVLDEPSIGLHQRDNHRLIETLIRLRDLGNTLIVVEHDEDTIRTADWVVDIGPRAGEHGGKVVVSGTVDGPAERSTESITGAYLSGRREIAVPLIRRPRQRGRELVVEGAREHNLRNIDVAFPLGCFVAVTGVSRIGQVDAGQRHPVRGAGQPDQRRRSCRRAGTPGCAASSSVDKVVGVDQSPIGRTPRSNPATYTGVFDHIRKLFAETTEAKVRGYQQGRFSFNVKGGRCEACAGDGTIKIEMNFLPDVYVPCEVCKGARYNRETLEVHYKGKTIAEVLDMPIEEAAEFFEADRPDPPAPRRRWSTSASATSGSASRRRRCPAARRSGSSWPPNCRSAPPAGRSTCWTSRPPACTSRTCRSCSACCNGLVDKGNTVIVIEHNLDVIKTADWVIDMGPEGGSGGGTVVAEGTPEEVADVPARTPGSSSGRVLDAAPRPVPTSRARRPSGRWRPAPAGQRSRACLSAGWACRPTAASCASVTVRRACWLGLRHPHPDVGAERRPPRCTSSPTCIAPTARRGC